MVSEERKRIFRGYAREFLSTLTDQKREELAFRSIETLIEKTPIWYLDSISDLVLRNFLEDAHGKNLPDYCSSKGDEILFARCVFLENFVYNRSFGREFFLNLLNDVCDTDVKRSLAFCEILAWLSDEYDHESCLIEIKNRLDIPPKKEFEGLSLREYMEHRYARVKALCYILKKEFSEESVLRDFGVAVR